MLKFNVIGIFNGLIENYFTQGVVGKAVQSKRVHINYINLRDFTKDLHQSVDDKPFGGSDGMLMSCEPLTESVKTCLPSKLVYLSPRGKKFNSDMAQKWAASEEDITLVCGRYAGLDERFINKFIDEEISIGDYVLSGGELAAMVIIDSVSRFIPGVLGHKQSASHDSFSELLIEAPQFTRPQETLNLKVPEVLTSGHHKNIENFKKQLSILTTLKFRPDLITKAIEQKLLKPLEVDNAFEYIKTSLNSNEQASCGFESDQLKITMNKWKEIKHEF